METSEKVVLREQPEIKDLLQTLMKQGLKKEQRRSYPIVLTSIQILRMVTRPELDIVNIGLHFFLKDVRPMLPPVMNHSIAVA